jgi:hypothetical protein
MEVQSAFPEGSSFTCEPCALDLSSHVHDGEMSLETAQAAEVEPVPARQMSRKGLVELAGAQMEARPQDSPRYTYQRLLRPALRRPSLA